MAEQRNEPAFERDESELKKYKDPDKAGRIWRSYKSEFCSLGAYNLARTALIDSSTSDELEVRLDLALTNFRANLRSINRPAPELEADEFGLYSKARRELEDRGTNQF